jgi:tetratricopeptide (TPR) repeat protein
VISACLEKSAAVQKGLSLTEIISSRFKSESFLSQPSNAELAQGAMAEIDLKIKNGEEDLALIDIEGFLLEVGSGDRIKSELLRAKGDILYLQSEYDDALSAYQESLRIDSDNSQAYCGLGFLAWQSHSNEDAISFFKKSLALKHNDFQTMLGLGLVHKRVGLIEHSIFWFEKCLSTDSQSDLALTALTQACNECSRPEMAVAVLNRAIDLVGDHRTLLMGLGGLYMKTGRTLEGRNLVNRALELAG